VRRDLVVIGASAGGIEALQRLAADLPADLPAAVLVVIHMHAHGPNLLPAIVQNHSRLSVKSAEDDEPIRSGRIYLCVPGYHLLIEQGRIRLTRGPRENMARPSVDTLFRSAAYYGGRRVIGIVLTGNLDDGTAGLWAIKDRGGIAMVQSPEEAEFPSMPRSAIRQVKVDQILSLSQMGKRIVELTQETITSQDDPAMRDEKLETEVDIALEANALKRGVKELGSASFYTCPECHGSMVEIREGNVRRFRCHTGHGFTEQALADHAPAAIEETMWSALAQLEEHLSLLRELRQKTSDADEGRQQDQRIRDIEHLQERTRAIALDPALRPPERQDSQ
jgi:two-component system chemotaxis response regulator CheB